MIKYKYINPTIMNNPNAMSSDRDDEQLPPQSSEEIETQDAEAMGHLLIDYYFDSESGERNKPAITEDDSEKAAEALSVLGNSLSPDNKSKLEIIKRGQMKDRIKKLFN